MLGPSTGARRPLGPVPVSYQPSETCKETAMKRYMIERNIPAVGALDSGELKGAAKTSNEALGKLSPKVQWQHSYVAADKTFCVYLAEDEAAIQEHAALSGFPATTITPIPTVIDPTTAG